MRFGFGDKTPDFGAGRLAGGGTASMGAPVGIPPRRAPAARRFDLNVVFRKGQRWRRGCLSAGPARRGHDEGAKLPRDPPHGARKGPDRAMGDGEGYVG